MSRFDQCEPYHAFAEPIERPEPLTVPPLRYPDLERKYKTARRWGVAGWVFGAVGWVLFVLTLITVLTGLPKPAAGQDRVMRYDAAVDAAWNDVQSLANAEPTLPARTRYVMFNTAPPTSVAAFRYACGQVLNFAGETPSPWQVTPDGTLWRLDLFLFADSDPQKFALLAATWDRQADTQFYLPTDKFGSVLSPRYVHTDGKVYERANVRVTVPAVPANAEDKLSQLIEATGAAVPIVSYGQFLRFACSASGGFYPEFRQIDQSPKVGTAEDAFLARVGITPQIVAQKGGDQRVVLMSKVSGNWRVIEYYWTSIVRGAIGPGLTTITRDWKRGTIRADIHGLESLAQQYATKKLTHDATEIIQFKADGGLEVALFDGKGKFLRAAPANVVTDRTVPTPFPAELDGGIVSCNNCHGPQNAMFQPAANYVTQLRKLSFNKVLPDGRVIKEQWDIFAEDGDAKGAQRVASLFKGETADPFALARMTHAKFAISVSNLKVEDATQALMDDYNDWVYGYVTPRKAMRILGYEYATEKEAVDAFNTMIPYTFEPNRISLLRAWTEEVPLDLTMDDFLEVLPELALRLSATEANRPVIQGPALPPKPAEKEQPAIAM